MSLCRSNWRRSAICSERPHRGILDLVLYDARDAGPMLRAHNVNTLDDRVRLIQRMIWFGQQAFEPGAPPIGGLRDAYMRQLGLAVTDQVCVARDDMCELNAIYSFVKQNVRYTGDITRKDTYQNPFRTLQIGGGDCDDHVGLVCVLAMENGFEMKIRVTSNTGATWDHIFALAGLPKHDPEPKRWVVLDTTLPGANKFNVHAPAKRYKDFRVREM